MNFPNFPFNWLMVRKHNGKMEYVSGQNFETRNESTARLIGTADYLYGFKDFDWVCVNTWDKDMWSEYEGYKVLSYCYTGDDYSRCVPDFVFDNWLQTHVDDYNLTTQRIAAAGKIAPETDLLGWRGAMSHPNRRNLLNFTDKSKYDIEEVRWVQNGPDKPSHCDNFVSLMDAARKWRFIIDVEGQGLSGRVKLHLFGKRVLFMQDRPYKEWWHRDDIFWPMEHYVPIAADLSDLEEKLDLIKSSPILEKRIQENAYRFALDNCMRMHALERWGEVLSGL